MLKDQIKASKPPTFYFIVYPFTPQQMQSLWENFGNILVLYFLLLSKRAFLSFFYARKYRDKEKKKVLLIILQIQRKPPVQESLF